MGRFLSFYSLNKLPNNTSLSTLGGRTRDSLRLANTFILGTYLATPHRHELIAIGHATTSPAKSPGDDIKKMRNKLPEIVACAPEDGAD